MEQKILLDKDGNPITREKIEEVFKEVFKSSESYMRRHQWEEDGKLHHLWQISVPAGPNNRSVAMWTNDAGAKQIHEAIKELINKQYGTT